MLKALADDAKADKDFGLMQKCLLNMEYEKRYFEESMHFWIGESAQSEADLLLARFIFL